MIPMLGVPLYSRGLDEVTYGPNKREFDVVRRSKDTEQSITSIYSFLSL